MPYSGTFAAHLVPQISHKRGLGGFKSRSEHFFSLGKRSFEAVKITMRHQGAATQSHLDCPQNLHL